MLWIISTVFIFKRDTLLSYIICQRSRMRLPQRLTLRAVRKSSRNWKRSMISRTRIERMLTSLGTRLCLILDLISSLFFVIVFMYPTLVVIVFLMHAVHRMNVSARTLNWARTVLFEHFCVRSSRFQTHQLDHNKMCTIINIRLLVVYNTGLHSARNFQELSVQLIAVIRFTAFPQLHTWGRPYPSEAL